MAGILKVDTVQDQDGNDIIQESAGTVTVGQSGQTVAVAGGATLSVPTLLVNGESVTAITLPTITSLSPDTIENTQTSVTITGTNFVNGAVVNAISTTGAIFTADTVTFNSATSITAQFTLATDGNYYIRVENPDGLAGRSSTALLSVSDAPTWSTAAGSLGTMDDQTAGSFTVTATSDSAITYSKVSGDFPGGLTLNSSTGEISGTESGATADTTYNFTIRATDAEGQTADRAFSITVDVLYVIDNSLRFDDGSSDYLVRTPSSVGDRNTWTYSVWIKRGNLGSGTSPAFTILSGDTASDYGDIFRLREDKFNFRNYSNSTNYYFSDRKYRDTSAWYNFVIKYDGANSTVQLYVNGELEGSVSISLNENSTINDDKPQIIGAWQSSSPNNYFDGYMAEAVMIDGQALDPTSFGEFDSDSGIWKPIDVSGLTFGTNGFYLDFENSGSLGADVSGNGNNFTVNNLTAIDQSTDTCTNNFATWNSIIKSPITLSEGNLQMGGGTLNWDSTVTTIVPQKGKWYAEIKVTSLVYDNIGFVTIDSFTDGTGRFYEKSNNITWLNNVSTIRNYQGASSTTASVTGGSNSGFSRTSGDIVMLAFDMENGYGWFGKNGTWLNSGDPANGTNAFILSSDYANGTAIYAGYYSAVIQANFGNPPYSANGYSDANGYGNMSYSVPSGYYILNTKNLAEYG